MDTAIMVATMSDKLRKGMQKDIKADFKEVHLTGNLAKTTWSETLMQPYGTNFIDKDFAKGKKVAVVHIPAVRYDIRKWYEESVLEFHPEWGSYAQAVNVTGGFSHYHVGYVEDAIVNNVLKAYRSGKYGLGRTSKFKLVSIVIK